MANTISQASKTHSSNHLIEELRQNRRARHAGENGKFYEKVSVNSGTSASELVSLIDKEFGTHLMANGANLNSIDKLAQSNLTPVMAQQSLKNPGEVILTMDKPYYAQPGQPEVVILKSTGKPQVIKSRHDAQDALGNQTYTTSMPEIASLQVQVPEHWSGAFEPLNKLHPPVKFGGYINHKPANTVFFQINEPNINEPTTEI